MKPQFAYSWTQIQGPSILFETHLYITRLEFRALKNQIQRNVMAPIDQRNVRCLLRNEIEDSSNEKKTLRFNRELARNDSFQQLFRLQHKHYPSLVHFMNYAR